MPVIGIVIGEHSGDNLGVSLIDSLRKIYPQAKFIGIGGPKMLAAGFESLVPLEKLSVMGITEVIFRLPELLRIRKRLAKQLIDVGADVVIGIDAPDFNLGLERKIKQAGIKTVHYVSPSVWAWRSGRIKKIKQSVDLMLTLFPFEQKIYQDNDIPVRFVGHTLADELRYDEDKLRARKTLGLPSQAKVVAIMPGSRFSEINRLAEPFLEACNWLRSVDPGIKFITPLPTPNCCELFTGYVDSHGLSDCLSIKQGVAKEAITASDIALVASGTATLEVMLLGRPMVMAYRLAPLTYQIYKRMIKVDSFSLPNLLAGEQLVPELIQNDVTGEALGKELQNLLYAEDGNERLLRKFKLLGEQIRCGASKQAAEAIAGLIE
ncbi:MAG: lipid-A-disaccharide synthase [Gammaproteobacteria bacterium]|nr:MAG: lipid-A-disaccharide synthase [Gammaproteobacteria bacterium]